MYLKKVMRMHSCEGFCGSMDSQFVPRGPVVCSVYRAGGGSTYTRTQHSLLLTNYSTTVQYYVNFSLIRCVLL